jgi:sodium-dependent phosphate cotransporter
MRSDGSPEGAAEAALAPAGRPLSPAAALAGPPGARWLRLARGLLRLGYALVGLFAFILALEMLKRGAGGLKPVLNSLSADGVLNLLGFGWAGAYAVMSGSPVAAISLSLFAGGTISDVEAFAMINGSRLGASFIVLFVGFLLYVFRRRSADGLYIGVVALLTAITLWLPVLPLGLVVLESGWFDSIEVSTPGAITSFVDVIYDPLVNRADDILPRLAVFALGVGLLLGAFTIFDRALPNLDQPSLRMERIRDLLHHPLAMFLLGLAITAVTLSVSISLTLLIPLSLKGYVRREGIIPYVMGANISTWVDTLVAALLLDSPRAFTIVFTEMVIGAGVSLTVLIFLYRPYSRGILWVAHRVSQDRRALAGFLGAIFFVPLVLFLV